MKDEILNDLLSDILQQQAAILKVVLHLKKQQEKVTPESINLTTQTLVVDDDFKLFAHNFFSEFNKGLQLLKALSDKIPAEINSTTIIEKNIVLFSKRYDEGHYGFKQLLNGFYLLIGFCFITFVGFKYYPMYLSTKDKNLPYKLTLDYHYYQADKKTRAIIIKTVDRFRQGDTLYINDLNRIKNNFYNNEND